MKDLEKRMTNVACDGVLSNKTLCPWALDCKLYNPEGDFMMHTPGYYVKKEFRCNLIIRK